MGFRLRRRQESCMINYRVYPSPVPKLLRLSCPVSRRVGLPNVYYYWGGRTDGPGAYTGSLNRKWKKKQHLLLRAAHILFQHRTGCNNIERDRTPFFPSSIFDPLILHRKVFSVTCSGNTRKDITKKKVFLYYNIRSNV